MTGARIVGVGSYLPEKVVLNDAFVEDKQKYAPDLDDMFDGMKSRRHADKQESSITMGLLAAERALLNANTKAVEIDLLFCYSPFPDYRHPNEGNFIASALGTKTIPCIGVDTACTSTLTMMRLAHDSIYAGHAKRVLIVSTLHWTQRGIDQTKDYSAIGDGSGAMVIAEDETDHLLAFAEKSYNLYPDLISMKSSIVSGKKEFLHFGTAEGSREILLNTGLELIPLVLDKANIKASDIDWFIFHQSGYKLMDFWRRQIGAPLNKILDTIPKTANVSAANVPIILDEHFNLTKKVKPGQKILFFTPAAGLHASCMIWKV